jgi:nicotinamide mononucleotide transporter
MLLFDAIVNWLQTNYIELLGTITGLAYIYLSIKQNIWLWPVGLANAGLYFVVYLFTGIYAYMTLQLYYLVISIYGWYHWYNAAANLKKELPVTRIKVKLATVLTLTTAALFLIIYYILKTYTDSTIPFWDALTTAASITATWMLARKILEHWLIWIVVDLISIGLYLYKELYITIILFAVYTIMAIKGFYEWRKNVIAHA